MLSGSSPVQLWSFSCNADSHFGNVGQSVRRIQQASLLRTYSTFALAVSGSGLLAMPLHLERGLSSGGIQGYLRAMTLKTLKKMTTI